ncbi:hypothetical protein [Helicobacter canis]|uniref:Uncharacterized protein n=1 Tax=Helicobacter canis TaxID=29419 RepID=A0A5M9QQZ8_9HELI|nr:hypothetical protein [Helicobacter canis]KAA8710788.1 hypothetical protein F4V45_02430 [Helicobacter canis]
MLCLHSKSAYFSIFGFILYIDSKPACDSALRDKSWIASRVLQLHTPSMRPCTRSQSPDFSSQILESLGLSLENGF